MEKEGEDHQPPPRSPLIQVCEEEDAAVKEEIIEKEDDGRSSHSHSRGIMRKGFNRKEIVEEVKKQLWLAVPLISMGLLEHSVLIIAIMFVGHLGELSLAGASLALSITSIAGFSLLMGLASALDTLSGQCYGAEQYHMLGIHMQSSMLVLSLVCIPLAAISAYTKPILIVLGQNADIAAEAGEFARFLIPALFAYALLECLARFLQAQSIVFPMFFISAILTVLHIPLCWALVFKSGLGSKGAALADSIILWIHVLLLALYVKFSSSCTRTWTGFSKEAFHNIRPFVKLAIPSAVMVCLEMWSFEVIVLLSGLLPNPKLETSVLSVSLDTVGTIRMIPYGLGEALSTRVSNELGAGNPNTARLAVCVNFFMAMTEGILTGSVLMSIRNLWGYAYSNEKEVIKYLARMTPILVASNFLDGLQCVFSGTARGCGWQKIGAYVNLGSYYFVGLPMSILLGFVFHIGGKGFWLGIICALTVQVLSLFTVTIRTNWEEEAKKATETVYASPIPVDVIMNHDEQQIPQIQLVQTSNSGATQV